jgi:hypothetical protein
MSDSIWDPDEVVQERIRRAIEEGDAEQARIQGFQDRVRDMPGQLGVFGEAMCTVDWLREGQS